ncbi:MAG: J domain-containing protein [Deltaproteobacteria bacterium]|nr:J domain-containing protein [Deltaproteobacteria bacterium]
MSRNFYVVLGVSSDAEPLQIRRAYRRLVKLYHPDVADQPVEKFHEIQEAYKALSDKDSQKQHNQQTAEEEPPAAFVGLEVSKKRTKRPVARPHMRPPSLNEEIQGLFSQVDDFFSGWVPGLFTKTGLKDTHRKNLFVELILEPGEALAGGLFPLQVPTEQACIECDGQGYQSSLVCHSCHGRGRTVSYHEIEVSVPPGVSDGTEARISLGDIGLQGVDLIVLVSINS